jgi:hypothetical protein
MIPKFAPRPPSIPREFRNRDTSIDLKLGEALAVGIVFYVADGPGEGRPEVMRTFVESRVHATA